MSKKYNPVFKARFGTESQIPVGKIDRLLKIYSRVKAGTTSLAELHKKDRTWILFAALKYDQSLTLEDIDLSGEEAADKDVVYGEYGSNSDSSEITPSNASSRTLAVDITRSLGVAERYFLDKRGLLNEISICLKGCDANFVVVPSTRGKAIATRKHLSQCL